MPPLPPPTADAPLPGGGERALRAACRLAIEVAAAGEAATPRVAAPPVLVPLLRHARLSAAAYAKVRACIDEDGVFRARVADAATPELVGQAGWLWLHRPVGWADDPAFAAVPADRPAKPAKGERDGAARLRQQVAEAEAARKAAAAQASSARRELASLRAERDALADEVATLTEQRREAVRAAKAHEADLATARAELRTRKQALIDLEQELAATRAQLLDALEVAPSVPTSPPAAPPSGGELDRAALEAAVASAASAAADLSGALARAAEALAPSDPPPAAGAGTGTGTSPAPAAPKAKAGAKGKGKGKAKGGRARRPLPALPPGLFQGTPEADRAVLAHRGTVVVVDGYNVARAAWQDLAPAEERRRTVQLLEGVHARSGAPVVVVFDGQDGELAPPASRSVRVRFSPTGRTADDEIAALVEALPAEQPVVVVSSDRAVARHAERHGALVLSSAALLAAVR